MREAEAIEFLRTRVGDEGYIVIGQVPDATGARQRRTMDALMVQCWPSRGLGLTAIEYKATVSDFRRELKQPDKADGIARYCTDMIVLAPKGVVPVAELPPAWGLWEIHKTEKQCRLLRTKPPNPTEEPQPIDLVFLTSVLRARERYNGDSAKLEQMREADRAAEKRRIDDAVKYRTQDHRRLQEKVAQFEEASGVKIGASWNVERLGKNLAAYLANNDRFTVVLDRQRTHLKRVLKDMDEAMGLEDDEA